MRRAVVFAAMVAWLAPARAQTHVVKKPESVVRAVVVYEWTGDEAKPSASRIVPVSLYINGQLEDGGVYMARPVPFVLARGNIFETQKAGVDAGTLELAFQEHLESSSAAPFDDGWQGFAAYKPNPKPVAMAAKQSGPLPQVVVSGGGNRPHFANKSDSDSSSTANASDPNRPTMERRPDSGSASSSSASTSDTNKPVLAKRSDDSSAPAPASGSSSTASSTSSASDDPNRPVLQRRPQSSDADDTPASQASTPAPSASTPAPTTSTASSGSDSSDDADRPTLKKRTPAQQAKTTSTQRKGDQASVASVGDLNNDPDRPTLHRGVDAGPSIVPLTGLPADMHQMVAVSDAKERSEHDFTRLWDSDTERAEVLQAMQDAARERLAKYDVPTPAAAPTPAPVPARPTAKAKKQPDPPPPPTPAPAALSDETLRGYTLSYGGAATFVYTASSPGAVGVTRYVTVVAQRQAPDEMKVALSSVTDSRHLDRTPWMRLIDVVDAEASNRASLLFEMRAAHTRQFALYRVIGGQAEQTFETGTTE